MTTVKINMICGTGLEIYTTDSHSKILLILMNIF